jgi:hypothetical protein
MKKIFRPVGALLILSAFALPLRAQNPNIAIHIDPSKECVKGTLKNLRPTTIAVSYIELWIYDAKTCARICVTRKVINKRIEPCQTMDFDLCCSNLPAASGYIYYVRVHHSAGINEEWAFTS